MPSPSRSTTPPRTAVAFRVGVTGHRPNRLDRADPAVLDATITAILTRVRDAVQAYPSSPARPAAYGDDPPILRVASSLAEGADRLVARRALDLGFALCCPMPFAREEYEHDFAAPAALEPDSLATFHALLERARDGAGLVTFELDGHRSDEGAAYGAAGRIVVNQSDLLVVIWDGREARGAGGTIQTMHEAIHYQLPVLWIDAVAPHAWQLVRAESDIPPKSTDDRFVPAHATDATWRQLTGVVTEILDWPPADEADGHGRRARSKGGDLRGTYFKERRPRCNPAPFWKLFRSLAGDGKLRWPTLRVPDFVASVREEWPTSADPSATDPGAKTEDAGTWTNSRLRGHYAWADRLADLYADKYRSSYVLSYPLAAFAVILALFPLIARPVWPPSAFGALEVTCIVAELVTVAAIIGLVFVGKARRWHDRWMEYRVLAEVIRQLRVLIPLGGGRPFIRVPGHLENYGEPSRTWMFAFMRALARATGLPTVRVDHAYVAQCLRNLRGIVAGQQHFHEINQRRYERIEHTLHGAAFVFLMLTILAILLHLAPALHIPGTDHLHHDAVSRWLTLVAAGLPALGSALAGISNQGEFSRVAKRSHAMAQRMRHLESDLATLEARALAHPASVRLEHITPLALHVVQLMVDENLEWRVVFADRPPTLPA